MEALEKSSSKHYACHFPTSHLLTLAVHSVSEGDSDTLQHFLLKMGVGMHTLHNVDIYSVVYM